MDLINRLRTVRIKDAARRLGFTLVGVAPAAPPPRMDRYRAAVAHGWHAGMAFLARDDAVAKRADPTRVLPGARSIVCVAYNYYADLPIQKSAEASPVGRVARYAWGDDYHDVLLYRLRALAAAIEAEGGQAKPYTDTGPICEVAHAARAGLGWIGKNGLLLNRTGGTWYLLGEVLTTLDLVPDTPAREHCGSCTRCLDACPTDAFPAPGAVDAGRCISYLTIEHKGAIPRDLRRRLGNWVFGCDVCQDVCPWSTRFAVAHPDSALNPRPERMTLDLIALLGLDDAAFRERFRGSPIKRSKRRGLLRNACVALGNLGDPAAVLALVQALSDPEPLIRGHAAWALGELGGDVARSALTAALEDEADEGVREEARWALAAALRVSP